MVFISGIAGQLFRDQALTVTFALVFSLIVALTLIPMLASLGGSKRYHSDLESTPPSWFTRVVGFVVRLFGYLFTGIRWLFWLLLWVPSWVLQRLYRAIAAVYPALLNWSLHHRVTVVAVAVLVFAGTMSLIPRLGTELIPQLSQGEFNVDLRLPPGAPLAATDEAIQVAQSAAAGLATVALDYSVAGTGNRLDANPVDAGDNTGTLSITLQPGSAAPKKTWPWRPCEPSCRPGWPRWPPS